MQTSFAHALLDPDLPAVDEQGRFNVYRNNLRITLRNALRTTFPAVEILVGEDYFSALTLLFVERHPPRSPIMVEYGHDFAAFLSTFSPLSDYPYLADVARIEFARVQAYHAADTDNLRIDSEASAIAALDIPAMLHPSVTVVVSENPALSIWRAQLEPDAALPIPNTTETAIIWRQDDLVAVMLANANDALLLQHFAQSQTFAALISEYPDDPSAEPLIARFINLAIAGIIVPTHTTIEGEMK
jgi:hypothetical protein